MLAPGSSELPNASAAAAAGLTSCLAGLRHSRCGCNRKGRGWRSQAGLCDCSGKRNPAAGDVPTCMAVGQHSLDLQGHLLR
ncbi:hypothetical protein WJX72_006194 [[Myrmecia] bisecta]|uniref:Secreted protein n=1 Tax=[Myrmecia] bisecta TaxID=41462 RepID=A0AAW1NZ00_9CHLO